MSISFRGTAHPPPGTSREHPADLNAAEIATTDLGGRPLLVEHGGGAVGKVLASWEGRRGELRVAGRVDDQQAVEKMKRGELRGLSLGTGLIQDTTGSVLVRAQDELSICKEGRRAGTWVDTIDGAKVHATACASRGVCVCAIATR